VSRARSHDRASPAPAAGAGPPARRPVPAEDEATLAEIAEEYYVLGRNQEAIAAKFGISRSYVSRLLNRARDLGVVEITIRHPIQTDGDLEARLFERFAPRRCTVVVADRTELEDPLHLAGRAAARYLREVAQPDHVIAVSWGTGVKAVVEALQPGRAVARHVVQMFGGLSVSVNDISGPALVSRLAHAFRATFEYLPAPWLVESGALAEALRSQPDVSGALSRAARADLACVGVGAIGQGSSALLFSPNYLRPHELRELERSGAVGDVCGRCFDARGEACRLSFDDRVIGLDLEQLRRIPLVVGVAVGAHKGAALAAALRGRLLDVLVTDRAAAEAVLDESLVRSAV
jgi:deoxyribonucleoside regulator